MKTIDGKDFKEKLLNSSKKKETMYTQSDPAHGIFAN